MSKDMDVEEFVRQFTSPVPQRKPAREIMAAPALPWFGPRLDRSRSGRRRWVTLLDRKPERQRFTNQIPML